MGTTPPKLVITHINVKGQNLKVELHPAIIQLNPGFSLLATLAVLSATEGRWP
jgi:hypothetical protein